LFASILETREKAMLRSILFASGVAAILAMAHPVLADPPSAAKPDHARVAASTSEQAASPAAASSSDQAAPASDGLGKGIVAVGFGWG
jgi:hypothetical protein